MDQIVTVGDDNIWGSNLSDIITGGAGNDVIDARGGNDRIIGGAGNDTIYEGGGDDTYVWNIGDGDDTIIGGAWNDGWNRIEFGPGITASDLRYSRPAPNNYGGLTIGVAGQQGSVTIDWQLGGGGDERIDQIVFADGSYLNRTDFQTEALAQINLFETTTPVVNGTSSSLSGAVAEIGGQTGSTTPLTDAGTVLFSDSYLFDMHDAQVVAVTSTGTNGGLPDQQTLLGWLQLGTLSEPSGGADGSVDWTFAAADGNFDYLAAGQQVTLTYSVRIADTSTRYIDQNIIVTVTGANDAPATLTVQHEDPVTTSFTVQGDASQLSANVYELTPNIGSATGAIWSAVDLGQNVTWRTRIFLGANDGGADGISFAIAKDANLGLQAGPMGVLNANSLGIRFDTWPNGGEPNSDYTRFILNGDISASASFDSFHPVANLEDNEWHDLVVNWNATTQTLDYSLDGQMIGSMSYDIVGQLLGGSTQGYFGFGGATGGATNTHKVEILSVGSPSNDLSVAENAAPGTLVGTFSGLDPDGGDTLTYSMVDASGQPVVDPQFEILNGNELHVRTGASFDYQTTPSYQLYIQMDDGKGGVTVVPTTVDVLDTNVAPSGLELVTALPVGSLAMVGSASSLGNDTYRLTPAANGQTGAVWGAVDLSQNIVWNTKMYFGANDGGADGVAFALQNSGSTAIGNTGVLLSNSLGIKFDTFVNGGEPGSDFTQIVRNGSVGDQSFDPFHKIANIEDGIWHDVSIAWDATSHVLSYSIDGVPIASKAYDIVGLQFGGSANAYYGFGGATGGLNNDQQVQILSIESSVPQFSIKENAAGGTIIGKLVGLDGNPGDALTYTLVDANDVPIDHPLFEIVNGNMLAVKSGADVDYESATSHSLDVRITDSTGASINKSFVVAILDEPSLVLNGTASGDILTGASDPDTLTGNDGNDQLFGAGGNDILIGGAGDDVLIGDTLAPTGANLITNGSFETYGSNAWGQNWGVATTDLPGWTKANSSVYELVYSGYAGIPASGSYWLDLDGDASTGSNMDISQTLSGLAENQLLSLSFDAANRVSAASGSFEVYWNGEKVADITPASTTMTHYSFTVRAKAGDNDVRFVSNSLIDGAGASLDNVQALALAPSASGDDIFEYDGTANGEDIVDGGAGNDTVVALSNNTVIGLQSIANVEIISANGHAGVIVAGTGSANNFDFSGVTLNGIAAIDPGAGDDTVIGSIGNDVIKASVGDDILSGGDGNDSFEFAPAGTVPATFDTAVPVGRNFIVNGSFEDLGSTAAYYWWGVNVDVLPGWTRATSAQYEIGPVTASITDGNWVLDLEAYYQNMDIS